MKRIIRLTLGVSVITLIISCQSAPVVYQIRGEPKESRSDSQTDKAEEKTITIADKTTVAPQEFIEPKDTGKSGMKGVESPVETVRRVSAEAEIKPAAELYSGGDLVYPFQKNHVYQLFTAVYQITHIELEPGEHIVSPPASGDTVNFILGTSYHIEDGAKRESVFVKPMYAGRSTTLAIMTDRRAYHFKLSSYEKTFMPVVSFYYPDDDIKKATAAAQEKELSGEIPLSAGALTDLDFAYSIVPHSVTRPHWEPSLVFNDGKRTYINFASAARAAAAPAFLEVDKSGNRTLLNYHIKGTYYIVDKVVYHAELILDINEGNIITILHKDM